MSDHRPTTADPADRAARLNAHKAVALPETLSRRRAKLGQKAKQAPKVRFYALYDRLYRPEGLETAWRLGAAHQGAPGVDGLSIEPIQATDGGPEQRVAELHAELRAQRYRAPAGRRGYIPKANGKRRPLGIPTVRDRVGPMAPVLILEPIVEAAFRDCSFGFRPGQSAHQARRASQRNLQAGYAAGYEADLEGYFDSIPQARLLKAIAMRLADRNGVSLIRQWRKSQGVARGAGGGAPTNRRPDQGTPPGGGLSPWRANIYRNGFDRVCPFPSGPAQWATARRVR